MAGKSFNLTRDSNILTLNSPKASVGGPYKVVYKNIDERWVIVAMDWELEPRLAIRWFWGNGGNPFSSGNPKWLVIPSSLANSILNGLPLDFKFHSRLVDFLARRTTGSQI